MIASEAMIRETKQSIQKATWDPSEEPVSLQLAGCEPQRMAEAAKLNEDKGAAIIDINMGCPVDKVTKKNGGSKLLCDPDFAVTIAKTVVDAVNTPVTCKIRLGWDEDQIIADSLPARL